MFHEFGDGDGAGESDGEMDVVPNAADEEAIAIEVARDGGEVGVELWADGGLEKRGAVLGGEDYVDQDEREGLWHWLGFGAGFQPLVLRDDCTLGLRPRL